VFDPVTFLSGELLVDALVSLVRPGERVLDLGTGSGLGALASARMGAREVVAVDIDPLAGRCAAGNVVLAGLGDRVAVRVGDLFGPVGAERFDLVAFNPPWLAAAPPPYGRALRLEPTLPIRFAGELASHLELRGRSLLVLPDDHRAAAWLGPLRAAGFSLERWCVRDRGSERLAAWVATPASGS
jgi:methylase of polypeptide subunit release factors